MRRHDIYNDDDVSRLMTRQESLLAYATDDDFSTRPKTHAYSQRHDLPRRPLPLRGATLYLRWWVWCLSAFSRANGRHYIIDFTQKCASRYADDAATRPYSACSLRMRDAIIMRDYDMRRCLFLSLVRWWHFIALRRVCHAICWRCYARISFMRALGAQYYKLLLASRPMRRAQEKFLARRRKIFDCNARLFDAHFQRADKSMPISAWWWPCCDDGLASLRARWARDGMHGRTMHWWYAAYAISGHDFYLRCRGRDLLLRDEF